MSADCSSAGRVCSEYGSIDSGRQEWALIKAHVIDPQGEWRGYSRADGTPTDPKQELSSKWKAAYHSGRALMQNAELLKQLAAGAGI